MHLPNPTNRAVLDSWPGESIAARYYRLVDHVRATYDPHFVGGLASVPEIARVEKAIADFQRQARGESDTPESRASAELQHREEMARLAIPRWRTELSSTGLPSGFFDGVESESILSDWRKGGDARMRCWSSCCSGAYERWRRG
jgi:hypothetical protein